eukprot:gene17347-20697_t
MREKSKPFRSLATVDNNGSTTVASATSTTILAMNGVSGGSDVETTVTVTEAPSVTNIITSPSQNMPGFFFQQLIIQQQKKKKKPSSEQPMVSMTTKNTRRNEASSDYHPSEYDDDQDKSLGEESMNEDDSATSSSSRYQRQHRRNQTKESSSSSSNEDSIVDKSEDTEKEEPSLSSVQKYILRALKANSGSAHLTTIQAFLSDKWKKLRKRDGSRYTYDHKRVIAASLSNTSSINPLFLRDPDKEGWWSLGARGKSVELPEESDDDRKTSDDDDESEVKPPSIVVVVKRPEKIVETKVEDDEDEEDLETKDEEKADNNSESNSSSPTLDSAKSNETVSPTIEQQKPDTTAVAVKNEEVAAVDPQASLENGREDAGVVQSPSSTTATTRTSGGSVPISFLRRKMRKRKQTEDEETAANEDADSEVKDEVDVKMSDVVVAEEIVDIVTAVMVNNNSTEDDANKRPKRRSTLQIKIKQFKLQHDDEEDANNKKEEVVVEANTTTTNNKSEPATDESNDEATMSDDQPSDDDSSEDNNALMVQHVLDVASMALGENQGSCSLTDIVNYIKEFFITFHCTMDQNAKLQKIKRSKELPNIDEGNLVSLVERGMSEFPARFQRDSKLHDTWHSIKSAKCHTMRSSTRTLSPPFQPMMTQSSRKYTKPKNPQRASTLAKVRNFGK